MKGGRRSVIGAELDSYMASRRRMTGWISKTVKSWKAKPKPAPRTAPTLSRPVVHERPHIIQQKVIVQDGFEDMSPGVWGRMSGFFGKVFGKQESEFEEYDFAPDVDFTPPEAVLKTHPGLNRPVQPNSARLQPKTDTAMQLQKEMVQNVQKQQGFAPQPKVTVYEPQTPAPQPEQKKKGWSFFSRKKKDDDYAQMPQAQPQNEYLVSNYEKELNDTKEDMREMTKIFLAGMERMPPEELHKFKRTEELYRLKVLLKKHNVIK